MLVCYREQLQNHVQYIEDNLYSFQNILAGGNYSDPGMLDVSSRALKACSRPDQAQRQFKSRISHASNALKRQMIRRFGCRFKFNRSASKLRCFDPGLTSAIFFLPTSKIDSFCHVFYARAFARVDS